VLQKRFPTAYFLKVAGSASFPYFKITTRIKFDGSDYFGPFPNRETAERLLETINRSFKLRECSDKEFRKGKKCYLYDIGRCLAPCEIKGIATEYAREMQKAYDLLNGKTQETLNSLLSKMKRLSELQKYEEAAETRDTINLLLAQINKTSLVKGKLNEAKALIVITEGSKKDLFLLLHGKIIFKGVIKTLTGLHIGASKETLEIGGLDAPVIKHPITKEPYIPGSSLKGKLRSLLEIKEHTENGLEFNSEMRVGGNTIRLHVCKNYDDAMNCKVCRVFGSSGDTNFPARIKVRDVMITDFTREFISDGLEIKFENSLDRITSASNPRQIERVPAGSEFEFEIIYNVENLEQLQDDLNNILSTMELLEEDALGGHGSRGYGRVKFYFTEITAKPVEAYYNGEKTVQIIKVDWNPKKAVENQKETPKSLKEAKEELLRSTKQLSEVLLI
jgi:CRISPR-associated protein Csm3